MLVSPRLLEDCRDKVPALAAGTGSAKEAGQAHNHPFGTRLAHKLLSGKFRDTVDVDGTRRIFLSVRLPLFAVKDIVRTDVDARGVEVTAYSCHVHGSIRVNPEGL